MQRIELLWYLLGTHSVHSHNKCLVGENGKMQGCCSVENSIPIHQHRVPCTWELLVQPVPTKTVLKPAKAAAMGTAPRDDKVRNGPASANQDCSEASQSSCHVHMEAAGPTSTDQDCSGWTSSQLPCTAPRVLCATHMETALAGFRTVLVSTGWTSSCHIWQLLWLALEQSWSALTGPFLTLSESLLMSGCGQGDEPKEIVSAIFSSSFQCQLLAEMEIIVSIA